MATKDRSSAMKKKKGMRPGTASNRYDGASHKKGPESATRTSVKNQIRSLKRLLAKKELRGPAAAKLEAKLRRLDKVLHRNVDRRRRNEIERKLSKKYHKVRFFERVKVERKIKRIKKTQAETSNPSQGSFAALEELQNDLAYIKFFPKGEKYISLFPNDELTPEQIAKRKSLRVLAIESAKSCNHMPKTSIMKSAPKSVNVSSAKSELESQEEDDFLL